MFFYVSKILWFVVQPSSIIGLMLAAGLLLSLTRRQGLARRLLWSGTAALLVLGLSPMGSAMILPLEDRFPRPDLSKPGTKVDGIIVLGGGEDPRVGALRGALSFNEAGERQVEALALARRFPDAKVVFSGGSAEIINPKPAEAEAAAKFFTDMGLDPNRLILEPKSRNTHENAIFTRQMVQTKPGETWLLVTSAFHMPRAIGCFRKAGFDVTAYPVDYRTTGLDELTRPFSSIPEGLRRVDFVVKEAIGLVAYYLSGRTDTLFPGP